MLKRTHPYRNEVHSNFNEDSPAPKIENLYFGEETVYFSDDITYLNEDLPIIKKMRP